MEKEKKNGRASVGEVLILAFILVALAMLVKHGNFTSWENTIKSFSSGWMESFSPGG